MVALRVLLPMSWGAGSHRASLWGQRGLAGRAVPLPQPGVGQQGQLQPQAWALPWGQGWDEAGTGHQLGGGMRSRLERYRL